MAVSDGYRVRNEELGPRGIPFVRGGDIGDGWINTQTRDHIRPELSSRVNAKLARPGDVAFIAKGTVGRAGRLREGQPLVVFAPQVAYWRVTDHDVLDAGFVYYLIRSREFQSALDGVKTHGAMAADYVSITQQHDFRFRIPDVESQRAIAGVLGALDDKIELNRRMNETLEALAAALFERLVRAATRLTRLGDCIDIIRGRSYSSSDLSESSTALVTLKSFARGGGYRRDGLKAYTGSFKTEQVVQAGEVVVACTDVTQAAEVVGRPAIVLADRRYSQFVASLDVAIVRPRDPLGRAFLYFLLRTDDFKSHAYAHTSGTTVLHLSKNAVPSYEFRCPPQAEIRAFESRAHPLMRMIATNETNTQTLAELRDTLLPKLISGELRVRDAETAIEGADPKRA